MSHFVRAFLLYKIAIIVAVSSENAQLTNGKCDIGKDSNFSCSIPNQDEEGFCVVPSKCSAYLKVQNGNAGTNSTPETMEFLQAVQCPEIEGEICCPKDCADYVYPKIKGLSGENEADIIESPLRILKTEDERARVFNRDCGKPISNRIYGGEIAELVEFPWMALLVYNSNKLGCGGVLISRRHVLTAAHCVKGQFFREKRGLKYIRLGEFNTRTDPDCIEERNYLNCADLAVNAAIDKIIVYPLYEDHGINKDDDIALIRLQKLVQITKFVMPICLPDLDEIRNDPFVPGRMFSVSGWGRTDLYKNYFPNIRSPIKLKLRVPIVSREICVEILNRYGFDLAPSQICAGGEGSKDTCAGDSGGPLMYFDQRNSRWVVYGIVSYGFKECGLLNHPGVYTNVLPYLKWIVNSTAH